MHKSLKYKIISKTIVKLLLQEVKMNVESTHFRLTKLDVYQPKQTKRKSIEQILARMINFLVVSVFLYVKNGFFASISFLWQKMVTAASQIYHLCIITMLSLPQRRTFPRNESQLKYDWFYSISERTLKEHVSSNERQQEDPEYISWEVAL